MIECIKAPTNIAEYALFNMPLVVDECGFIEEPPMLINDNVIFAVYEKTTKEERVSITVFEDNSAIALYDMGNGRYKPVIVNCWAVIAEEN
jgi:hypothetical protein